ncbi:MAG: DMT family transporter [Acidimicrobiales bacterium]|jgi:drug/metabolite transporter (DMT)-like permease
MSRRGWLLFAALGVIWGVPYLLIRISVREVAPSTLVFFRTAPVALILLPVAAYRGQIPELLRRWRPLLLYTAVEIMLPWLMLFKAEERLSSSLAGLLVAAVPLVGAVVARLAGDEDSFDRQQVGGLLLGLGGVALLVGIDVRGATAWPIAALAVPAVGYAIGPRILNRYLSDLPGLGVVAASLAITAIVYLPFALSNLPAHLSTEVTASLVTLALVPTLIGFLVFFALINEVGPVRMTVVTYLNPAVAIVLGVVLLGEPFTLGLGLGFPLVIAGSVLATRRRAAVAARSSPAAEGFGA